MIRNTLFAAAALAFLTGPAFANQCPGLMADIDAALQTAQLSEAEASQVKELRAEGERQHQAGDHAASVETLNQAKQILGIE